MTTCYQKHPFAIETEDHLTAINTKIFEIKKKIQLSEGQRKSHYEEFEAEKQQNNNLIDTLKKEIKERMRNLLQARALIGEDEVQIKKYLNDVCPVGNKTADQMINNLDLKVIEQRKILDLLKYEKKHKKTKLKTLEKEYEHLLIENTKSTTRNLKIFNPGRKHASHLENQIHRVIVQWNEAELVKKKYSSIRLALSEDSVKFESSLAHMAELLKKQRQEIKKLEMVREEALDMRAKATVALAAESARAHDAEHARATERAYFAHRFEERRRELEKLEKRIFPPAARPLVRQESTGSGEAAAIAEDNSAAMAMDTIFQRLMKLTGVTEPEEVFDRFRAQRETSQRLKYLQTTTEAEKVELEQTQAALVARLEEFKFAQVKDKDEGVEWAGKGTAHSALENVDSRLHIGNCIEREHLLTLALPTNKSNIISTRIHKEKKNSGYPGVPTEVKTCVILESTHDQIAALKTAIEQEEAELEELEKKLQHVNTLLMELKKLLYNLCKLLEFISESPMPEWTLEPRDVQSIVGALTARYALGSARAEQAMLRNQDAVLPNLSMHTSGASPSGALSATSGAARSTPQEDAAALPTYKQLLQKEPQKPPASDEEEDIPSRSYLKRQAQLIVDTKSRRKGFRQYPRK
ncbi:Coiled-coil domain-containing protein 151 [Eumeta japonica]|uniref:Coiled-coil domain-containing protein 151 n=1 Tax=Eumeta variegata TaxID=151549 RepID=A0A4C1YPZ2_EUMVA|nr:Coiled-coil domain-containing protein 151 [Eumeta japonica]